MTSLKPDKPKFGYIGDPEAAIAREAKEHTQLISLDGGQASSELAGIIIDGQSAGAEANPARLFEGLASGLTVAVVRSTAEILEVLRSITGQAPAQPALVVAYSRLPQSDPVAYNMTLVTEGPQPGASDADQTPAASAGTQAGPISWEMMSAALAA